MILPLLATVAANAAATAAPAAALAVDGKHVARILHRGDGNAPQTAYRVSSAGDEHAVLQALGLQLVRQSTVTNRDKTYDLLHVRDPASGAERILWFDISDLTDQVR